MDNDEMMTLLLCWVVTFIFVFRVIMYQDKYCKICGQKFRAYNILQNKCRDCTYKTSKPIPKIGKKTKNWIKFREGYLKGKKNHEGYFECSDGTWTPNPDLDHKKKRSTNPELVFKESNIEMMEPAKHRIDKHLKNNK